MIKILRPGGLCLLLAVSLVGSVSAREKVRVAVRETAGNCFVDQHGQRDGYVVEWLERLAMRLDWDLEWVEVGRASAVAAVREGRADLSPVVLTDGQEVPGIAIARVPIGFLRMAVFAPANSVFDADDIATMDGLVVGMLSNNPMRARLDAVFAAHGVKGVFREFATEEELLDAYASGVVGAVLSESTDAFRNAKTLLRLPPHPYFIAVAENRRELATAISEAVSEIIDIEPEFALSLRAKYFRNETSRTVVFSAEEKAWIQRQRRQNRVFTVDISPADRFLKIYDEEGETIGGLVGRIFAEVSARTGLIFHPLKPRTHEEVSAAFAAGRIDIRVPSGCQSCESVQAADPSHVLSIRIPQAVATRHFSGVDIADEQTVVALDASDTARIAAYEQLGIVNRVTFPSAEEALQAVVDEKADCFVGDYPQVRRLVRGLSDPLLVDVRLFESSRYHPTLNVIVSAADDRHLVTVLAKSFALFDSDRLVGFENDAEAKESGLGRIEMRRLLRYAGGVLLSVSVVVIAILLFFGWKTRKLLHKSEASLMIAQDAIDDAAMARTKMREALEEAEYAAKAKANFLATMSHEIRTPLNAVVGFSEFLAAPGITLDKVGEYARGISLSANALLSLINDILDMSKFESGKTESLDIRIGECDLGELFAEMDSVFRMRIERKGLTLDFAGAASVPPLVLSEARLRQILLNLLGNAVKFTERGGITVSAEYVEGCFRLQVGDTGIGISPRGIEHIFDPFAQDMDSRGGKVYAGTGLGLSIVKRIVEASGGTISVRSEIGVGSDFTIELPDVAVAAKRETREAVGTAEVRQEIRDVVIVDDVAMNRKVLKMHCLALGIERPVVFESGLEVLDYLKDPAHPCDIVLSDMWMPGMDGSELARRCAELRPELPVVAVTADTDAGATFDISLFKGVLTKPVTAAKLSKLLAKFR